MEGEFDVGVSVSLPFGGGLPHDTTQSELEIWCNTTSGLSSINTSSSPALITADFGPNESPGIKISPIRSMQLPRKASFEMPHSLETAYLTTPLSPSWRALELVQPVWRRPEMRKIANAVVSDLRGSEGTWFATFLIHQRYVPHHTSAHLFTDKIRLPKNWLNQPSLSINRPSPSPSCTQRRSTPQIRHLLSQDPH
jgi:hypothetical protein